jgi:hypothetical protein
MLLLVSLLASSVLASSGNVICSNNRGCIVTPDENPIIFNNLTSPQGPVYSTVESSRKGAERPYSAESETSKCSPEYTNCETSNTCCDNMKCVSGACQNCRFTGETCGAFYTYGCCFGNCDYTDSSLWGICH